MEKEIFSDLLAQNRRSCSYAFNQVNAENVSKSLNVNTASVGFIYWLAGETMLQFGYFFGKPRAIQNTTMGKQDEGQGNDVEESKKLVEQGFKLLEEIIESTPSSEWSEIVETPFFGALSKTRLFSHVLYHNSYHAGQIGLALKRGI